MVAVKTELLLRAVEFESWLNLEAAVEAGHGFYPSGCVLTSRRISQTRAPVSLIFNIAGCSHILPICAWIMKLLLPLFARCLEIAVNLEEIETQFGPNVAKLVDGVTKWAKFRSFGAK